VVPGAAIAGWSAQASCLQLSTPTVRTRSARYVFVIMFFVSDMFLSYSLSSWKRCKSRCANGAMITDAIPIKASPENKA